MTNRMISVVAARIASASGRCARSDACWSRKPAVCPPTLTLERRRRPPAPRARSPWPRRSAACPGAIRSIRASLTRGGATGAAAAPRTRAPRRPRRPGRARCRPARSRSAGTRSGSRRRRSAPTDRCGSTDASMPVNWIVRNGSPSAISSTAAPTATGDRPPHHALRVAVPEAAALGPRLARDRLLPAPRPARVDALAEHPEQRRQQRQRDAARRSARTARRRRPSSTGSAAGRRSAPPARTRP